MNNLIALFAASLLFLSTANAGTFVYECTSTDNDPFGNPNVFVLKHTTETDRTTVNYGFGELLLSKVVCEADSAVECQEGEGFLEVVITGGGHGGGPYNKVSVTIPNFSEITIGAELLTGVTEGALEGRGIFPATCERLPGI